MTFAEFFGWASASALKILFTPSIMTFSADYSVWEVLLATISGSVLGSILFYFLGGVIFKGFELLFVKNKQKKSPFNKKNRRIVKVKSRFGLIGLAYLMGPMSVPIGSFVVSLYYKNPAKAIPALILSAVSWCVVLTFGSFAVKLLF